MCNDTRQSFATLTFILIQIINAVNLNLEMETWMTCIILLAVIQNNQACILFKRAIFSPPVQVQRRGSCQKVNSNCLCGPQVQKLQGILKPMMLRRLKEDVEKKLAPKEETIIEVELTNIQKKYYRAILEKNFSFLAKGAGQANMPNLVNTMMELRKCCNHPYLIKGRTALKD